MVGLAQLAPVALLEQPVLLGDQLLDAPHDVLVVHRSSSLPSRPAARSRSNVSPRARRGPRGSRRTHRSEHRRIVRCRPRRGALRVARGPLGARGDGAGVGDGVPRRHGGQRGPAHHRRGPGRRARRAPVDRQRVRADPRGPAAAGRIAGRPVRAAAGLHVGGGLVRGGLGAVRPGPHHRGADRGAGPPGGGRGPPHPGQPRPDRGQLPAAGSRGGHRGVVGARRRGGGDRAVPGRLARAGDLVAPDLPHQPAAGRGGGLDGHQSRARVAQPPGRRGGWTWPGPRSRRSGSPVSPTPSRRARPAGGPSPPRRSSASPAWSCSPPSSWWRCAVPTPWSRSASSRRACSRRPTS